MDRLPVPFAGAIFFVVALLAVKVLRFTFLSVHPESC